MFTIPKIDPKWRTDAVVALCQSMREAQDWSTIPALGYALQSAGCPVDHELIAQLWGAKTYAHKAALVASVWSDAGAIAVNELAAMIEDQDCPRYEATVAAAAGNHQENAATDNCPDPSDYPGYMSSHNDGEYLFFGGRDAHGPIPKGFWELVELATGVKVPDNDRAGHFACSC